jgi:uncharacterized membrane protein YkvI
MGPRAGVDNLEKRKFFTLPGLELRLLGRPARSQSLYRLRYPGSMVIILVIVVISSSFCLKVKLQNLTPWRGVLLEKLIFALLFKKFPLFENVFKTRYGPLSSPG